MLEQEFLGREAGSTLPSQILLTFFANRESTQRGLHGLALGLFTPRDSVRLQTVTGPV